MLNKDTAESIAEIANKVEVAEYEEVKFLARDMALTIDQSPSKDNLLWIMCLRLTAQIIVDAQKNKSSVSKYLEKVGKLL